MLSADLDGDGDLDIAYADHSDGSVWLNDGSGIYSDCGQALDNTISYVVTSGDLDADGDLDLMYARRRQHRLAQHLTMRYPRALRW